MGGSEAIYTMPMRELIERIIHGQSVDPMWREYFICLREINWQYVQEDNQLTAEAARMRRQKLHDILNGERYDNMHNVATEIDFS